jgi:hypothetical protein
MAIIAALAVGVFLSRQLSSGFEYVPELSRYGNVCRFVDIITPLAAALTMGFLLLNLRRPRPSFPQLLRQPGVAGCLAVQTILVVATIDSAYRVYLDYSYGIILDNLDAHISYAVYYAKKFCGCCIISVWINMYATNNYTNSYKWIDCVSWFLCMYWIFAMMF